VLIAIHRKTAAAFALSFAIGFTIGVKPAAAQFPPNQQASAFLGGWCAQGDPTKQASISANGPFLTLTNENGDTSPGNLQGQSGITAPGWQFVNGTLSPDGSQINWSNGTFWARCNSGGGGGGGGGRRRPNLNGTWYPQGNRSGQSCTIHQRGNNLSLTNEQGASASGQLTGRQRLTTNWNGTTITGTVSANGNRINWNNGTYWTRFVVYSQ
jgi:hypothetical protein